MHKNRRIGSEVANDPAPTVGNRNESNTHEFGSGAQPVPTIYPSGGVGSGVVSGHGLNPGRGIGSGASPNYSQGNREIGSGAQQQPTIYPSGGVGSGVVSGHGLNPGRGIGSGTSPIYSQVHRFTWTIRKWSACCGCSLALLCFHTALEVFMKSAIHWVACYKHKIHAPPD
uniref:Uncharacterized protein n=1 Tax=Angiostrongylus cantonensis TaxID=6313 RepID=A0A0K0D7K8_ANGCA